MKNILILFIIFLLLFPNITFGDYCDKYSGKISECDSALKDFIWRDKKYITQWASIKSIENFPCLQASTEKRVAQIVMDENFKKVDKEMEEVLRNIYESKDFYFGKDAKYSYIDWLSYIFSESKKFLESYNSACELSIWEVQQCFEISVEIANNFLAWSNWYCYKLARFKVYTFWEIAYNWLLLNREQVSRDQKKLYQQWQRTKYEEVLDLIIINLSYIEKIWKSWPSKTRNPL